MKWPHWLRHAWSGWYSVEGPPTSGGVFGEYRPSAVDQRECSACGRRQRRSV